MLTQHDMSREDILQRLVLLRQDRTTSYARHHLQMVVCSLQKSLQLHCKRLSGVFLPQCHQLYF